MTPWIVFFFLFFTRVYAKFLVVKAFVIYALFYQMNSWMVFSVMMALGYQCQPSVMGTETVRGRFGKMNLMDVVREMNRVSHIIICFISSTRLLWRHYLIKATFALCLRPFDLLNSYRKKLCFQFAVTTLVLVIWWRFHLPLSKKKMSECWNI